jgi:arachidonate 15-lipoxygenase
MPATPFVPSLPQHDNSTQQAARAFQLSLARTEYNYMRSYLAEVPLSADLPSAEKFSLDYEAQVLKVFLQLADNFKAVVMMLLRRELGGDLPTATLQAVRDAYATLEKDFSLLHPVRDLEEIRALLKALAALPDALKGITRIPGDLEAMATGLEKVFADFVANGPTAFLKSTLFDMLSRTHGRNYLQAKSLADYEALFISLPAPLMLALPRQAWMPDQGKPCEQDWFFGALQTAGFNTTNLRGVLPELPAGSDAISLPALLAKMPVSDAMLQRESGDSAVTLAQAARERRLYAVDYTLLVGATADALEGQQRYLAAPIALFYWNPKPPAGYPSGGALQPIAIQLAQQHDPETAPIFTPQDAGGADDANGLKWRIAKYIVNVVCAIEHESVAHLGDCHLIVEPIVVAAHRQLAVQHPLLKLLLPHFRFTININDSAIHSLIVPGGVVATNVGPSIESTLQMLSTTHGAWRWDERHPARIFQRRGVEQLPEFAFRDDTLLLWQATQRFVSDYLRTYYRSDADVRADRELQAFIAELTNPQLAGFKGMNGLEGDGSLASLDYLIEIVAQIIYTAGPQHAAVNYAQYPLMSYMPSVAGTIYAPPPTRSSQLQSEADCLPWFPPLDVGLYTFSFEYLLSGVQFDRFGHYEHNPRDPYFEDPRIQPLVSRLQGELALAEIEIQRRNATRPLPYPYQLPSQVPNSISI